HLIFRWFSALYYFYHDLFYSSFFFFTDTATNEIYTLSLHDALPISWTGGGSLSCEKASAPRPANSQEGAGGTRCITPGSSRELRSEEHTSELQSRGHLVCRLLLEKKKRTTTNSPASTTTHVATSTSY